MAERQVLIIRDNTLVEVFTFVREYIQQHGFSPSLREIGEGTYISYVHAGRLVQRLADLGKLTVTPKIARGIVLLDDSEEIPET